ncbi:hypothetical protein Dimus_005923, partial [Dionaea muscipula]
MAPKTGNDFQEDLLTGMMFDIDNFLKNKACSVAAAKMVEVLKLSGLPQFLSTDIPT